MQQPIQPQKKRQPITLFRVILTFSILLCLWLLGGILFVLYNPTGQTGIEKIITIATVTPGPESTATVDPMVAQGYTKAEPPADCPNVDKRIKVTVYSKVLNLDGSELSPEQKEELAETNSGSDTVVGCPK